jgi:hypothetical protein
VPGTERPSVASIMAMPRRPAIGVQRQVFGSRKQALRLEQCHIGVLRLEKTLDLAARPKDTDMAAFHQASSTEPDRLTTLRERFINVKKAILIGVAALAIGGATYLYYGQKPVGLQCQMTDETSYYGKNGAGSSPDAKQHTWVLELNGSTWRLISQDGQPMKEMLAQLAKANGKNAQAPAFQLPLRTTDEAYVLMEPEEKHDGNYDSKDNGFFIDRISGTMTGESWLGEKSGDFGTHLKTTGKCSPTDIKANL